MKMICDVPDEVIKSVRMGTWCGSSVAEKMIANGIPLEQIRAEIESIEHYCTDNGNNFWFRTPDEIKKDVLKIIDKYKSESENKE